MLEEGGTVLIIDNLENAIAKRMRTDYIAAAKPNAKSWEEIDEGMRAVWLLHARSAIAVLKDRKIL